MIYKTMGWLFVVLIVLATMPTGCGCLSHANAREADAWQFRFFGINSADFRGRKILPVIVGGLSSFVIHELGHIAAAELTGMDARFDFDSRAVMADNYYGKSNSQKTFYHAGGFIAQALVGTVLTAIPKIRHSDFNVGFTRFASIGNIMYGITGGLNGGDISDVQNLNGLGYNGNAIAISASLYSGILTYINLNKERN